MSDVCIVGIGIHPFGRTEGLSGIEQGVFAVRQALGDAGIAWPDIQFAYGGSDAAGNPDTMVERLGFTGIQFINVRNGCAAGGSSLASAAMAIQSGAYDIGLAVGFDKHPRGAFNALPSEYGLPDWYGEAGYMITTQFFAAKITRYMHEHGISQTSLGRVAEKAFRNAVHAPHAWRREPVALETILEAPLVSDPYTKYMFCSPAEGGVALILATGGSDMVRAAHSVGKPAYGVGPGNVPVYVDRSADIARAAKYIVASKAFDHSVICATEQAVVADRPIAARLEEAMKAEGAYFVDDKIKQILAKNLFVGHLPNPKAVGRSPQQLAQMYGFNVPDWARIHANV